jgi:hypothetical protein
MSTMVIKRIGVLSVAKIYGVIMAVFGLIIGVIGGLYVMIDAAAARGIVAGLAAMILGPVFYGILGFVGGALGVLIYNAGASTIGGVELELESATPEYITAPPPQPQWAPNPYSSSQQPH